MTIKEALILYKNKELNPKDVFKNAIYNDYELKIKTDFLMFYVQCLSYYWTDEFKLNKLELNSEIFEDVLCDNIVILDSTDLILYKIMQVLSYDVHLSKPYDVPLPVPISGNNINSIIDYFNQNRNYL